MVSEGEFVTQSLQVPGKCHFAHVIGRNTCNGYEYWNGKAESECAQKVSQEGEQLALRSFAILEPCGLDMFRGVEFVCCPKAENVPEQKITKITKKDDDEDDDDDEEDDEEESDSATDEDSQEDDDKSAKLDPYFKDDDTRSEHERFKEAEERLEKKHRKKVTKVITEWSDLFERYNKMRENDPKGAEEYKREMTARFRKTVAALEEENKEQRKQIEDTHDERVQTVLNEKKREATHEYRSALAVAVGGQNKQNVLRALKTYIKAEEKDRNHMLNRYRHLLRSDPEEATAFEPILMHRLRYIDLRINGTLAMLRDFPELEKQINPIAMEFWREYRIENTPEINDEESLLFNEDSNEKLIQLYKKTYERSASLSDRILVEPTTTTAPTTTTKPSVNLKTILSGKATRLQQDESESEEEEDDDEDEESVKPVVKKININVEPIEKKDDKPMINRKDEEEDESYEDDEESDEEKDNSESLHVVVEPIVQRPIHIQEELPESSAFAKQERLVNEIVSLIQNKQNFI